MVLTCFMFGFKFYPKQEKLTFTKDLVSYLLTSFDYLLLLPFYFHLKLETIFISLMKTLALKQLKIVLMDPFLM